MVQKLMVTLEVAKGEHVFTFSMPVGAPLGAAYDAAHEVLAAVMDMAAKAVDNSKPQGMSQEQLQDAINSAN